MDRSEIIVYNEKIMSQIKPNPVTGFRYETKSGLFIYCGGCHTTDPQSKIEGCGGTFLFLMNHASADPHQR